MNIINDTLNATAATTEKNMPMMQSPVLCCDYFLLLLIILLTGTIGGVINYLSPMQPSIKQSSNSYYEDSQFYLQILLGICGAALIPLLLYLTSSKLFEKCDSCLLNYFVFAGYCLIGSIFSRAMLNSLAKRLDLEKFQDDLNKQKRELENVKGDAKEARDKTIANEKEIKNTKQFIFDTEDANINDKENSASGKDKVSLTPGIKMGYIDREHTMLGVATGTTYEDNFKYGIYYDPASRNHGYNFTYIGLYKSWGIRGVGEVVKIVYCDYDKEKDSLKATKNQDVFDSLTKEEKNRIKDVIKNTEYYDLESGNKFYLVDKFYKTEYILDTPIFGKQYFWLNEYSAFKKNMSAEDLARMLSGIKS